MQPTDIEFLQRFREEAIMLPKEQRPDKFLEERFTHSTLIRGMIAGIEREDRVISGRISNQIKKMLGSFSAFVRMDPSSAQYFIGLSKSIRRLLEWIGSYQNETQTPLLNRLKCIRSQRTSQRSIEFFGRRDIVNATTAIELYYEGICRYYETFCHYFEGESRASGNTMVISETGHQLYYLLTLIGKQIQATEITIGYLKTWQIQTRNIEIQAIYN